MMALLGMTHGNRMELNGLKLQMLDPQAGMLIQWYTTHLKMR
jgi:hypothetical protein